MAGSLLAWRLMRCVWPWILAVLSGGLMALAYPPFNQDWLIWLALTPLICAVWFGPATGRWRVLRLLGLGYATGLTFFWGVFFWVTEVSVEGWFALAFYLGLYPAVWALYAGTVGRPRDPAASDGGALRRSVWLSSWRNLRLAALGAAAWVGLEWVRGTLFTGLSWNSLGVALHGNIALIQIADLTGVGGVSFLVAMANLMLVMTFKRLSLELGRMKLRPHFDFSITLALIAGAFSYGVHHYYDRNPDNELPLKIAAVQANIPQDHKWDPAFELHILDVYRKQTEIAVALRPELLIWPEAATPRPVLNDEEMKGVVVDILGRLKGDFLLGSIYYDVTAAYNSALLLGPDTSIQLYNKIHLVPFGEYVPFRRSFPFFAWIVGDLVPSDFDAGVEPVVFQMKSRPVKIAPLICFEDTIGDLARQFAGRGAQLLITLTNDGWFRESAGSEQHLANSVFRAVETKLPLVRAANTGVTCFIDRLGRVTERLESDDGDTFIEGVLFGQVKVPVFPKQTLYTRYGELFSLLCLCAALVAIRGHVFAFGRKGLSPN